MGGRGTTPFSGIILLIAAFLWGGIGTTLLEGEWGHWPWLISGIIVGLWAVAAVNRRA